VWEGKLNSFYLARGKKRGGVRTVIGAWGIYHHSGGLKRRAERVWVGWEGTEAE